MLPPKDTKRRESGRAASTIAFPAVTADTAFAEAGNAMAVPLCGRQAAGGYPQLTPLVADYQAGDTVLHA
jgi:hypothetical protein